MSIESVSDETWKMLWENLDGRGFVTDEDAPWLTRVGIARHLNAIEKRFRELGFDGGQLKVYAYDRLTKGYLYVVYDTDEYESSKAAERSARKVYP